VVQRVDLLFQSREVPVLPSAQWFLIRIIHTLTRIYRTPHSHTSRGAVRFRSLPSAQARHGLGVGAPSDVNRRILLRTFFLDHPAPCPVEHPLQYLSTLVRSELTSVP
jgi:hypothetical protein